ncbi:MAG: AgmX/PglI C-terminal domain-containing protein [Myxococcota bacterium]
MNVTCDKCQKRYSIADEKVRGKTVKVKCKHCQNVISVRGPPDDPPTRAINLGDMAQLRAQATGAATAGPKPAWEEERTTAMPALDLASVWFAMVKGKQTGPMDVLGLEAKVKAGEVSLRTFVWKQGMADWKRASELPELSRLFAGGSAAPKVAPPPAPPLARSTTAQLRVAQPMAPVREEPGRDVAIAPQLPAPEITQGRSNDALNELFSDAQLPSSEPELVVEKAPHKQTEAPAPADDPFAALGALDPKDLPPPGESTQFFIAQAGVNKRNPPWKIGLFIGLSVFLPVGLLYLLSTLHIPLLQVTRVTENGEEVQESVFSAEGVAGLRDLLTGKNKKKAVSAPVATKPKTVVAKVEPAPPPKEPSLPTGMTEEDMRKLYGEKADKGPIARKPEEVKPVSSGGGLKDEDVAKVVAQYQPSFLNCVETELKRNPNFKGGKVSLNATVGSSGIVTAVSISRKDIELSELGGCLKLRAKNMKFPTSGEDSETEVQIPLILGTAPSL